MRKLFSLLLAGALPVGTSANAAEALNHLSADSDFRNLSSIPGVSIDLRYASENNFTHVNLYGEVKQAFLHRIAAGKLAAAAQALQLMRPGYRLLVLDATRPRSVQRKLWKHVEGTPEEIYVANPDKGSVHNFGFAVDLSIIDEHGKELDMGTDFDSFDPLSQPQREEEFLAQGRLSPAQLGNRLLLRKVMEDAGFIQLPQEWWHFDALPGSAVRGHYRIIE